MTVKKFISCRHFVLYLFTSWLASGDEEGNKHNAIIIIPLDDDDPDEYKRREWNCEILLPVEIEDFISGNLVADG